MAEPKLEGHWRHAAACGVGALAALLVACGSGGPSQPSALPTRVAVAAAPTPAPTPPPPPRVALVTIDGLRADAVSSDNTPNMWGLVARGAYTFSAQTIFPSNTLPSHTSMLTGVEPSVHGVTFDEYRDTFQFSTPTAMSLVHAAGKRSVMVVGKDKFRQLVGPGTVDSYAEAMQGDEDVVNEAMVAIGTGFDFLFVHLPQVDQVGHVSGWMSPEYLAQVKGADAALGRLITYLPAGTTIIVTADHGGNLKIHGTTAQTDLTIPWIIVGPRVTHHGAISHNVRTTDTALTILAVLGVTPPSNCTGKVVAEIFDPQP